jgi:hypothetical protein
MDTGRFVTIRTDTTSMTDTPTTQTLLTAFDAEATAVSPYLSVPELQAALLEYEAVAVSRAAIRDRLSAMHADGLAVSRQRGDEWVWRATVGPEPADTADDATRYVPLDAGRARRDE